MREKEAEAGMRLPGSAMITDPVIYKSTLFIVGLFWFALILLFESAALNYYVDH